MYSIKVKRAVAGQLVNMIMNDIINQNGIEPFIGWCADGEVYESLKEDEIIEAMKLTEEISGFVDNISAKLNVWE